MTIGERLKKFLKKQFGSIQDASKVLDITREQLYPYFNNEVKPGTDFLLKLYKHGCDINWLLSGTHITNPSIVKADNVRYIPIEEAITNGKIHFPELPIAADIPAGRNDIRSHDYPEYFKFELDPRMYFVLRIDAEYGYSMQPLLKPGDLVICFIDKKNIKSGDLVVIRYDGTKGAIKLYIENPDVKDIVVLESINKSEVPIILKKSMIIDVYKIQAFWKK